MRKVGFFVLAYDIWAFLVMFIWWFGLGMGIGDSGFEFNAATKHFVNFCNIFSSITAMVTVPILFLGSIVLIFRKSFGRRLSVLGIWGWGISASVLAVTTFLYNLQRSSYNVIDFLYAIFVVVILELFFIFPGRLVLKKLKQLQNVIKN